MPYLALQVVFLSNSSYFAVSFLTFMLIENLVLCTFFPPISNLCYVVSSCKHDSALSIGGFYPLYVSKRYYISFDSAIFPYYIIIIATAAIFTVILL